MVPYTDLVRYLCLSKILYFGYPLHNVKISLTTHPELKRVGKIFLKPSSSGLKPDSASVITEAEKTCNLLSILYCIIGYRFLGWTVNG